MEHILSLSYGKDSLACLGAIKELGLPLDRIIHAEIWATKTIPADLPPMIEFKVKADKIIKERYGITVEHVSAGVTYEDVFYRVSKSGGKSKNAGHIYGFPMIKGSWCNSKLKVSTLNKIDKNTVSYIGIAYDEPKRFKVLSECKVSPLVKAKWTEKMCYDWCFENDLLSPIYTTSSRGGCWFCHNQSIGHLRLLRRNYPEYWNLLLKWDIDSPISFKPSHTVHDFEERFRLEDEGIIFPNDNSFKWKWLNSDIQLKFFA
ncbi:MAG: reductase [Ruminococcus flavefaciens]|nr:reductase [Ruminococcus flavefaciens]MCM1062602.1 reductase [Eubacterium sp.]